MPDRFANGDPGNDSYADMAQTGVNRQKIFFRHGGDLVGVMEHLDYLEELGVTALWLNPVLENNQPSRMV
jgi:glycosidase